MLRRPTIDPLITLPDWSNREKSDVDEHDIQGLFTSLLAGQAPQSDETREVFSLLIKTTLRYRDHLLQSEGIVVTVDDVRMALDWLVPSLTTGRLPKTDRKISLNLLKLWLDGLKVLGKPEIYPA